ncbi:isochorismatase family cysteine hydrolase [Acinetobacter pittii]|uniref:isochorismatase family cysteine hydrolase n=1 Tax=Acinetobacter pittii TaxID=48296 RepID=UPI000838651A|nr:isochorismatase family cysteine hydrolase [Acinetobacter pittii]OCY54556.1 hypothetical protein BFR81_01080 [Acinetobacter pittii]ODL96618.1 hypothetical protein AXH23_02945 [Acinetobacter pittii]
MSKNTALIMLDYINDIVHPDGKYAKEGYYNQIISRSIIENASKALKKARELDYLIIHVIVGFSKSYSECPSHSTVFELAKKENSLQFNTWSTDIYHKVAPLDNEIIISKNRVSPFFQTNLELILRNNKIENLIIAGISTEFVVLATCMEAHDRDYQTTVIEDATASSTLELHTSAINVIRRTSNVKLTNEIFSIEE